ncbi:hypothetical protein SPRG_04263 [Saprolegnia parasitica CBS 223.65]|uniref:FYVE-type domain-containing protein n=1 Tax=Saprolegnia parasitica (strain CBS 223.65) TaxID=695850 RepID=A0A067CK64_SAPPC|nr:hypothetical protein SPRG_04263 [Saprolegnia parasitica CBS 223.65]KDO31124.1 hypothetical protein SPRG_04263 [Saprolegnia parasitica CBS 223.65]|eukprot:XP_012198253.1 hypothetical protein SPRG_04263 [Saprolegnia parasitica CBS 223.65]
MPTDQPLGTVHWSDLKRGDEWVDDSARASCYTCDRKFTPFRRRHHCRMCGEVVCAACTGFVNMVPAGGPPRSIRICTGCILKNRTRYATDRPAHHRSATTPVTRPLAAMAISAPGKRSQRHRGPTSSQATMLMQSDRPRVSDASSDVGTSGDWDDGDGMLHFSASSISDAIATLPPPPVPINEAARLAALHKFQILDTPPERAYQAISDLLAKGYNCPYAGVSFVDADRIWYKAVTGVHVDALPRAVSFCSHAIMSMQPTIILDASTDIRVQHNPLVTSDIHIQFYAAAPIVADGQHVIGTVFVFDTKPHKAMIAEAYLTSMATMVRKQLEARIQQAPRVIVSGPVVAAVAPTALVAPPAWRGQDATPNEMHSMLATLLDRTKDVQAQLASQRASQP